MLSGHGHSRWLIPTEMALNESTLIEVDLCVVVKETVLLAIVLLNAVWRMGKDQW